MRISTFLSGKSLTGFTFLVFCIYLLYRILLISNPYPDIGGVENNVVYFIQRLLSGESLYTDPEKVPYSITQYSPFYYYFTKAIGSLLGIRAEEVMRVFMLSRTVSLCLNLLYAFTIYLIGKDVFSLSMRRSCILAMMAFIFLDMSSFSRPDSLNHFLYLLSIYFFLLGLERENEGRKTIHLVVASGVIAACAFFSKQSAITLPVIILIWYLWKKQFSRLFYFFISYAIASFIILLLILQSTSLWVFYKNILLGVNNGINLNWYWSHIITAFFQNFGLIFIPAWITVHFLLKKENASYLQFSRIYLFVAFITCNLFAVKFGSSIVYFTEWWSVLFLVFAYYWDTIVKIIGSVHERIASSIILFIILLKLALISYPLRIQMKKQYRETGIQMYKTEKKIAEYIKNQTTGLEYPVFNNLYSPESFLNNFLFHEAVMPQFDVVIFGTYPRQVFDYSDFKQRLNAGKMRWIITKPSGSQLKFIYPNPEHFQLRYTLQGYNIYQFKL
jgi:hypothetical protein